MRAEAQHAAAVRSGLFRGHGAQPAARLDRREVVHRGGSGVHQHGAAPHVRLLLASGAAGHLEVQPFGPRCGSHPQLAARVIGQRQRPQEHHVPQLDAAGADQRGPRRHPGRLQVRGAGQHGPRADAVVGEHPVGRRPDHAGAPHRPGGRVVVGGGQQRVVDRGTHHTALERPEGVRRLDLGGHSDIQPGAPVQRHHPAAEAGAGPGQRVQEAVRRAVVDLAEAAGQRGHRRAQHDRGQREVAERGPQPESAEQLGRQHRLGVRPRLDLGHPTARDAGCVHDHVQPAEPVQRRPPRPAQVLGGGHVAGQHQHLGAQPFHPPDRADRPAGAVPAAVHGQVRVPPGPVRQRRPGQQHQPGLRPPGQLLGHRDADAAGTAGDEVDRRRPAARRPADRRPAR